MFNFPGNVNALVGIMLIVLGSPLALSKVAPNAWYGVRTTRTLSNPQVWYNLNCQAGQAMILIGSTLLIFGLITLTLWLSKGSHQSFLSVLSPSVLLCAVSALGVWLWVIAVRP